MENQTEKKPKRGRPPGKAKKRPLDQSRATKSSGRPSSAKRPKIILPSRKRMESSSPKLPAAQQSVVWLTYCVIIFSIEFNNDVMIVSVLCWCRWNTISIVGNAENHKLNCIAQNVYIPIIQCVFIWGRIKWPKIGNARRAVKLKRPNNIGQSGMNFICVFSASKFEFQYLIICIFQRIW